MPTSPALCHHCSEPSQPCRLPARALAWAHTSSSPWARSEGRDVPVHCCQQSDVLSWGQGSPQDFVPWLTRLWLPHSLNAPAPLRLGLQRLSSLGHQRLTFPVLGGAQAVPPTQPAPTEPRNAQESPGQGVAQAQGIATAVSGVMPRKPGRCHHPESKQLQSTRKRSWHSSSARRHLPG